MIDIADVAKDCFYWGELSHYLGSSIRKIILASVSSLFGYLKQSDTKMRWFGQVLPRDFAIEERMCFLSLLVLLAVIFNVPQDIDKV